MSVIIRGQLARLSRGRHSAKHMASGSWAGRDDHGDLVLDQDGRWMISTSDGFARKSTEYIVIRGGRVAGSVGRRFTILSQPAAPVEAS